MNLVKNKYFPFFIIFLAASIFYLPIFLKPNILLERENDLQGFFWPIIYFVKNQIITNHQLPFWNNVFFGGTPLLPDPQSPLFYIPNVIFLFLPIGFGFVTTIFLHLVLGGIGIYFASKNGFGLSKAASIFAAIIYIISPKFAGYLEAGHFGLITAWAFLPFVVYSLIKLTKSPNFKWSLVLAICLAGLFFSHILTFLIALVFSFGFLILSGKNLKSFKESFIFFVSAVLFTFGLISVSLLPQLSWKNQTTRSMLISERDVYPKWTSKFEFIRSVSTPWITGIKSLKTIETEKTISLGLFTLILALIGFLKLSKRNKVLLLLAATIISLIALNNASPIYRLLLSQDLYVLTRVSTRVWFAAVLITVFLAAYGFDKLKKENRKIRYLLGSLAIVELLFISWSIISKPIGNQPKYASEKIINQIKKEGGKFRVFCLNHCISQKTAAEEGLELTEGYGTLQQTNYYHYFIQLAQSYFNKYSLSLPPFEIYLYEKLQPHAPTLAEFNVKYVISPHELTDKNFSLVTKDNGYFLYENTIVKPRAYFLTDNNNKNIEAPIIEYLPNRIVIDTSKQLSNTVILAEVYNSDWKAYSDNNKEIQIQEAPNSLRRIDLPEGTNTITLIYEPNTFKIGKVISLISIVAIILVILK
jgi:hypothetical protein